MEQGVYLCKRVPLPTLVGADLIIQVGSDSIHHKKILKEFGILLVKKDNRHHQAGLPVASGDYFISLIFSFFHSHILQSAASK